MADTRIDPKDAQLSNRIIQAMVDDGHVSSAGIARLTGLSEADARLLADALNDDGKVSADELKRMEAAKGSARLLSMARFIGDAPERLYEDGKTIQAVRAHDRCGPDKLGDAGKDYADKSCTYTLEGTTSHEIALTNGAIDDLKRLAQEGKDITPALGIIMRDFPHGSYEGLSALAERFDFTLLSDAQKEALAERIRLGIIDAGDKMDGLVLMSAVAVLAKLGTVGACVLSDLSGVLRKAAEHQRELGNDWIADRIEDTIKRADLGSNCAAGEMAREAAHHAATTWDAAISEWFSGPKAE
jgi:hypothetical protein